MKEALEALVDSIPGLRDESNRRKAAAWDVVFETLEDVVPGWRDRGRGEVSVAQRAANAIRGLAERAAA